MKHVTIFFVGLLVLLCVAFAGCTSGSEPAPASTPVPETTATPAPALHTPAVTATPTSAADAPLDTMPEAQAVNLELTKDRPTSQIHLLYQGGAGIQFTQKIVMWVYNADGTYKEYVMSNGKRPSAGDEIIATGTRSGDRCVVFVTSAGTTYKMLDKTVYSDM